jgi:methyl-accepting chemotaxis protein
MRNLPLALKLVLLNGLVLLAIALFLAVLFPQHMTKNAKRGLERKAADTAVVLAGGLGAFGIFELECGREATLKLLASSSDALYAEIRTDNAVFQTWRASNGPARFAPLVPEHGRVTFRYEDDLLHTAMPLAAGKTGDRSAVLQIGFSLAQLQDETRSSLMLVLVVCAVLIGVGIIASYITARALVKPIVALNNSAKRIVREGDLNLTIDASGKDETGQLATTFVLLVAKLREIPTSLRESTALLSESVARLNSTSSDQSKITTRQAAALQETQVTVQEIKQTSLLASQKAEAVLRVAERADDISRTGESAIEQSLGGLTDIRSQVETIAQRITELGERTRQIGVITETVKDLADQSNMLALNAAIEAVRSGEAGKGFGVVAREIRSLADQSIQATNRVREILDDIGGAVRTAVSITERGAERMEAGLSQIKASGDMLRELSSIVKENASAVRQIAAAVSQQNAGISQIFSAVTDLNTMMDETMVRLEENSKSVDMLLNVSERVSAVVSSFRV